MKYLAIKTFLVGLFFCAVPIAQAQNAYPSRPVKVIVSYPPGGAPDIMARLVAVKLSELWGQPVIVDNKPGANGNIGAAIAAKSAPDGYTLFMNTSSHAIGAGLYKSLNYDLIKDFSNVTMIASVPNVLVISNTLPFKDVKEFIEYAKQNPGKLNFGSAGSGSNSHLAVELFQSLTGTKFTHIPYKGNTGILTDLVGGNISFTIDSLPPYLPMVKEGRIKALGISSVKRSAIMPNLPTISESGVSNYRTTAWFGFSAPIGMPQEALQKISTDTMRVLKMSDVITRLAELGAEPGGGTPEQFDAHVKSEVEKFLKIIQDVKIQLQ